MAAGWDDDRAQAAMARCGMPKVRDAIRLVEREGWYNLRTRGSHRQFHHPVKPGTVTIPGRPGKELEKWLWRSIMRQAGLRGEDR